MNVSARLRTARLGGAAPVALGAALVLLLWLDHLSLALEKHYNIDEFQYAHGAWLISQGGVIYRDFFEHHFPLIHQLMAGVFVVAGDEDPNNLIYLRLAMLPLLTLTLVAAALVNRRHSGALAVTAPLVVLMVPTFSAMAVEVRPDPLAFSLFLSSLAVLYLGRLDGQLRGFLSGFLAVAALWATLKAAYYGLIFPAALVADLIAARQGRRDFLLGSPWAFLGGSAAAALPIAAYLTWTSSWADWFEWCIRWSFVHQWTYPGHFWTRNFVPLLSQSFWLFPLAVLGIVVTLRARPPASSPDWLLTACAATSLASFAWQSAAYLYSLVPFTVVLAIFASRGLVSALRWSWRSRQAAGLFVMVLLVAVVAVEVQRSRTGLRKLMVSNNKSQHELLSRVHQLTRPHEPVLNIAGGQITRPSVHFFYFFEAVTRQLKHDVFANELPMSLAGKGCIAYMPSDRFGRLPEPLRRFLLDHYQPYDRELWFWGHRWTLPAGRLSDSFLASRDGRYFVWPLSAPQTGTLNIGGRPVTSAAFDLPAGLHTVTYEGDLAELFMIWLPADGQPFEPRPELKPRLNGSGNS